MKVLKKAFIEENAKCTAKEIEIEKKTLLFYQFTDTRPLLDNNAAKVWSFP